MEVFDLNYLIKYTYYRYEQETVNIINLNIIKYFQVAGKFENCYYQVSIVGIGLPFDSFQ